MVSLNEPTTRLQKQSSIGTKRECPCLVEKMGSVGTRKRAINKTWLAGS